MKKILIIGVVLITLSSVAYAYSNRGCTGSKNCTACKNCSGCKHCAKQGGTCGVCN